MNIGAALETVITAETSRGFIPVPGPQGIPGAQGPQGVPGATGAQGPTGYSPVRGVDFWTAADIAAIEGDLQTYIDTQLGVIINGSY